MRRQLLCEITAFDVALVACCEPVASLALVRQVGKSAATCDNCVRIVVERVDGIFLRRSVPLAQRVVICTASAGRGSSVRRRGCAQHGSLLQFFFCSNYIVSLTCIATSRGSMTEERPSSPSRVRSRNARSARVGNAESAIPGIHTDHCPVSKLKYIHTPPRMPKASRPRRRREAYNSHSSFEPCPEPPSSGGRSIMLREAGGAIHDTHGHGRRCVQGSRPAV